MLTVRRHGRRVHHVAMAGAAWGGLTPLPHSVPGGEKCGLKKWGCAGLAAKPFISINHLYNILVSDFSCCFGYGWVSCGVMV